jgi:hypothetical protein
MLISFQLHIETIEQNRVVLRILSARKVASSEKFGLSAKFRSPALALSALELLNIYPFRRFGYNVYKKLRFIEGLKRYVYR